MQLIVITVKQILSLYFSNRNFTENGIAGYMILETREGDIRISELYNIGIYWTRHPEDSDIRHISQLSYYLSFNDP